MDEDLARCKDLAARAREMAKHALKDDVKKALRAVADDYERRIAEIEAKRDPDRGQAG